MDHWSLLVRMNSVLLIKFLRFIIIMRTPVRKNMAKSVLIMTIIKVLPTKARYHQRKRKWELIQWSPKRKCFDLLSNSLNELFKELYWDQFREFVCGHWGLLALEKQCVFALWPVTRSRPIKNSINMGSTATLSLFFERAARATRYLRKQQKQ